jgi:hypothetical protein
MRRCPSQPNRTVSIGGADFKDPCAKTAADQYMQKLSRLWFQIQHLLAAFLFLGVVLLPSFIQLA